MEDWAEIRQLHRAEGLPIKEIARRLGIARNTVRVALRADQVPRRERGRASDLPMRWKTSFGCCWRSGRPCRRR